jgi:hypothetical protein
MCATAAATTPASLPASSLYLSTDCLADHRGLLGTEWRHFRGHYGVRYDLSPGLGNTAFFPEHGDARC